MNLNTSLCPRLTNLYIQTFPLDSPDSNDILIAAFVSHHIQQISSYIETDLDSAFSPHLFLVQATMVSCLVYWNNLLADLLAPALASFLFTNTTRVIILQCETSHVTLWLPFQSVYKPKHSKSLLLSLPLHCNSAAATLAFLLLLKHPMWVPASGSLHLPFSLVGKPFPKNP